MASTYYAGDAASFNTAIAQANNDPGSTIVITADFNSVNPTAVTQPLRINLGAGSTDHKLGISGLQAGSNSLTVVDNVGAGFLSLTGLNNFGALSTTFLTLSFDSSAALGGGPLNIYSCTLAPLNNTTLTQDINLNYSGASINTGNAGYALTLSGAIRGGGALFSVGTGNIILSGANSFTGGVQVQSGRVVEQNTGAALSNGAVAVASNATLELYTDSATGFVQSRGITLSGTGTLEKTGAGKFDFGGTGTTVNVAFAQGALINVRSGQLGGSDSRQANWVNNKASLNIGGGATFNGVEGTIFVDALTGSGTLEGGFYNGEVDTTTIGVAGGSGTFTGTIRNNVAGYPQDILALTKAGAGTETLTGTNTYTGATTISAGTLLVNGSIAASATTVANGGTLGGSGTTGAVTVQSGGTLSPGNSPGLLNVGNLSLASGSQYVEQIGGTEVGTGYDQTNVTGTVALGGATLNLQLYGGFTPTPGQVYTIINNDGTDGVAGTFAGLSEGASVSVGAYLFTISYKGGVDRNDVTLTSIYNSANTPPTNIPTTSNVPTPGPDYLVVTENTAIAALAGNDTIFGFGSNNQILGNQGDDTISLSDGPDTALGGMGDDLITVSGSASNLLYGNEGADTIQSGNGNNTILGGSGIDSIDMADGADLIRSGVGNDLILGNGGDDTVAAGAGNDTALGGFGNDVVLGQQGNDLLLGNQGADTLVGGQGADTLVGGMGNDVLYGSEGDDVLYGNEGSNRFVFNPGDTDFVSGQSTGDMVADFKSGTDKIDFASGPVGTATDFAAVQSSSTEFAQVQALAQTLLNGTVSYAFVADGTDGYLFATGGSGTAIQDAVKLVGAGSQTSFKYTDIAHSATA